MSRSGLEKRADSWLACCVVGVRARRLVGRLERGSWEVGIDSGMGSDIVTVEVIVCAFRAGRTIAAESSSVPL